MINIRWIIVLVFVAGLVVGAAVLNLTSTSDRMVCRAFITPQGKYLYFEVDDDGHTNCGKMEVFGR